MTGFSFFYLFIFTFMTSLLNFICNDYLIYRILESSLLFFYFGCFPIFPVSLLFIICAYRPFMNSRSMFRTISMFLTVFFYGSLSQILSPSNLRCVLYLNYHIMALFYILLTTFGPLVCFFFFPFSLFDF